jgi:membrane protein implicated in regulation of membrane protease activity
VPYPVTLLLLLIAFILGVVGWLTSHGPTINGFGFLAIVFVILAMLALWVERGNAIQRRR